MRRTDIETDYGCKNNDDLGCTVWIDCTDDRLGTMVMSKGKILDTKWWEAKIQKGKHIKKEKIIIY